MDPKEQGQPILTEDGQRLTVSDYEVTGTADTGSGLAYETGNTLDDDKHSSTHKQGEENDQDA